MDAEDKIIIYGLSNGLIERGLDKTEKKYSLDLQRTVDDQKDEEYYPQFDLNLRVESHDMAKHYELFYCLENSIRKLVAETLKAIHGEKWWESRTPDKIKDNVKGNMQREVDSGFTLRSDKEIDYTTFGELGEIVRINWVDFDAIFSSEKAFTRIMTNLNMLRNPIAHCCPLAEDEIVRIKLIVKDWFRLME